MASGKFENDVDCTRRVDRRAVLGAGAETNSAGRFTSILIEPVAEAADETNYLDLSSRGKENLQLDFALNLLFAGFRGVTRFGFVSDFHGSLSGSGGSCGVGCRRTRWGRGFSKTGTAGDALSVGSGCGSLAGTGAVSKTSTADNAAAVATGPGSLTGTGTTTVAEASTGDQFALSRS